MSLSTSRYAKTPPKPKNQWEEFTISEGNMTDLIASFLQSISAIPDAGKIDKVAIGDLHNRQYVLAVAFKNGKED